jgi:hypothetical protein
MFARCMRELVDVDCPQAERIRVVMDNLSTHTPGSRYEAFLRISEIGTVTSLCRGHLFQKVPDT